MDLDLNSQTLTRQLAGQPILDALDSSVSEAQIALAEAERVRAESSSQLTELRTREGELRTRLNAVTDGVHGLEMQIYEKKLHLSNLLHHWCLPTPAYRTLSQHSSA